MSSGRTRNPPRSAYIVVRTNRGRRVFKALSLVFLIHRARRVQGECLSEWRAKSRLLGAWRLATVPKSPGRPPHGAHLKRLRQGSRNLSRFFPGYKQVLDQGPGVRGRYCSSQLTIGTLRRRTLNVGPSVGKALPRGASLFSERSDKATIATKMLRSPTKRQFFERLIGSLPAAACAVHLVSLGQEAMPRELALHQCRANVAFMLSLRNWTTTNMVSLYV